MIRAEYVLLAAAALATVFSSEIESNFYYSEPCGAAKGSCVLETECPHAVEGEFKDLCPGQKDAVCCKEFPQEKLNCFQMHNDCRESCPRLLDVGSKGCPNGLTCCVLV